jgi:hypothetical protein
MAFPRQGRDCHRFRLYEDGDPTVSRVTREIAGFSGGDFLSRVINRLAADKIGAVELWLCVLQSNRANSICSWSSGQPFQVGNEQQAADSGPDETTSQPLPLDLLVAQDSALSSDHGEPAAARIDEVQNLMPELPSSLALRKSKAHRNSLSCKGASISLCKWTSLNRLDFHVIRGYAYHQLGSVLQFVLASPPQDATQAKRKEFSVVVYNTATQTRTKQLF